MNRLAEGVRTLELDADLQLDINGRSAVVSGSSRRIDVKFPDVATAWALLRSAVPRGFRIRSALDAVATSGFTMMLCIGRRTVLELASRSTGILAFLGLPHVRVHPIALVAAAISP